MSAVDELLKKLLHPARLLFVKSDKRQADALQQQIQQKYECVVDWAASVEEAKRRLGEYKYDLLLLEPVSQEMATAVLRHVKQIAPTLPVVLISDLPYDQVAYEVAKYGVVCGLIGPVEQADIDDLFTVFKVRVRSHEDTRYFESRAFDGRSSVTLAV